MLEFCGASSGFVSGGTVPSAFNNKKLESPPAMTFPFWSTSFTLTRMFATGLLESANTVADAPECAAMVTVWVITGAGNGFGRRGWLGSACWKDAKPAGG